MLLRSNQPARLLLAILRPFCFTQMPHARTPE
ncbi:uncharacterized protein CCOS01_09105 [Colletotrichum costaricense]|uniref:Uncharacterized protein n=2 Tax=Colletotrichum acutatum species complex TaxID=2707335 RepID=A0AAI9YUY7_9PEZI|nr:uncharacterized protein CCOS01_09105 [Colletotrichum costaricense]XP_060384479.1 uncharacterized protein CTAM01_05080 [Colletotrichum tamarilloi]KAK1503091.1 hypothetical protein CTAM01_05080 [Colletotrichum tamarilloi]KAK1524018.1 hypothetical protein CCOS01_09105 [Colletotrichum costaricense]